MYILPKDSYDRKQIVKKEKLIKFRLLAVCETFYDSLFLLVSASFLTEPTCDMDTAPVICLKHFSVGKLEEIIYRW